MKWFHDLPIARKLAVGFTLTTLMTVVLGAFALVRLSEANAKLTSMATNDIPSVQYLGEVRSQLGEFRTYELAQISMLDQPEKVADYNKRMNDTAAVVREQLAAYAKLPSGDKERTLYQAVQADVQQKSPIKRFGQTDEVARTALFLASDDASYIVGQEIVVDGGMSLL